MFEPMCELLPVSPPAIVVEDEAAKYQRLVQQGQEAAALEAEGKNANVEWVQALREAYPDVIHPVNGQRCIAEIVRKIVMEVRQCTRSAAKAFIQKYKSEASHLRYRSSQTRSRAADRSRAAYIRRAAVELATKYRLGADPAACMEALAKLIEESR